MKQFLRYQTIAGKIRSRIIDGAYPLNSKLPSEETLAREFEVSRPTVKSAIRLLEEEGVVTCRPSIGSFILRHPGEGYFVGYIAPDLQDPFHGEVIGELDRVVRGVKGSVVVSESGPSVESEEEAIERLAARGVKGILVTRALEASAQRLPRSNTPLVFMGGVPGSGTFTGVSIDNVDGVGALANHLAARGCRTVGYVAAGIGNPENDVRHAALRIAAPQAGLRLMERARVFEKTPGVEGGRIAMRRLLAAPLPDAVVCHNDWTALGVVREALAQGIPVPEKLKVTGFDNLVISRYVQVPLTTVDYRIGEFVRVGFELLRAGLSGGAASVQEKNLVLIKGALVVREST